MLTLIVDQELRADPSDASANARPDRLPVNAWADDAGQVFARAYAIGTRRWIDWRGLGRFSFEPGSMDVRVRACSKASPRVLQSTFDRVIQPVILQALGWQALHGSGVIGPAGPLVFCGLGRSGKSTLAYAAGRRAGFTQFADDAIVIQTDGERARACPLPFATGLREDARTFVGSMASMGSEGSARPEPNQNAKNLAPPIPIRCLFVLSQDVSATADVRIDRVAPADAFALLLTHAHCFDETDAVATRHMVEAYLSFAEYVPVLALTYRPDFAKLDALVDAVLEAATRAQS